MVRETLSRAQIVTATIEMLDAEGLEALSMRKLGQRLDSAATSVYWHVGSKENLIVLASDRAWSEIELPTFSAGDWRAAARTVAHNSYHVFTRHHWLVAAASTHFVYGLGMARFQDHNYAIYEAAGFTGIDLDWAYNTVFDFVLGAAIGESQKAIMLAREARGEGGVTTIAAHQARAEEIMQGFPRLRARMAAQQGLDRDTAAADSFDYGIDVVLGGLEARLTGGSD